MSDTVSNNIKVRSTGVVVHSGTAEREAARAGQTRRKVFDVALDVARVGANVAGASFGGPLGLSAAKALTGSGSQIGDLNDLFNRQIAIQRQMQEFTARTNISKTEHESKMSAIRNMKA